VVDALACDHRLVRYDERGNGLSDWDCDEISFEAFVRDLETVVDTLALPRFALLGISQGCAVSIAYAVRHPERVSHLILHGGYAQGFRRRGSPELLREKEALGTLIELGWGRDNPAIHQFFTALFVPDSTPEQRLWFTEIQRVSASPANAIRIRNASSDIDVTALLGQVRTPTLVLHSTRDEVVPFSSGLELAGAIAGARFVPLESRNHLILEQEPAWPIFRDEVRRFLAATTSI
jgi:pimeloyl-ACP methyl ester carboxylesterase